MSCGAAVSLGPSLIVNCERGDHQNLWYHQGRLVPGSHWDVRWEPAVSEGFRPQLVRREDAPR